MSEDQGPEAFVKLRSAERRTGLNGLRGRDEFQAEWRNEGLTGTYLFELEAHPGWPQGRSLTTTGSKPIGVIERPRRGRPWSRSFLSDGTIADVPAAASPHARNLPAEHAAYTAGNPKPARRRHTQHTRYDANGNLTKKTTIATGAYVTYTWDYRNRLTDVESYNSSNVLQSHEHYTYDVFNRLIEEQIDPTGGGTYTSAQSFVYGVDTPPLSKGGAGGVASTGDAGNDVILIYNGSGTLTDRFLNSPSPLAGRAGVGAVLGEGVLADENGSGIVSWSLADNEGTTRDVVQYNSSTNTTTIVDHLEYNSFGVITAQSNSAYQPIFAYAGQMWDSAAGLYAQVPPTTSGAIGGLSQYLHWPDAEPRVDVSRVCAPP